MDILQKICDDKLVWIAECKTKVSEVELREVAAAVGKTRGFAQALRTQNTAGNVGLIAEIKKASPSKGLIRDDFNPPALAAAYESGGATCLSVLTDIPYFQGDDRFLTQAREACTLPALRKDFMLDTYQVTEARALGADCILIIMAVLSNEQAKELEDAAHQLGMDTLVEIHDEEEMQRAITHLQPDLLGVNNRNLKTMEISLANTERMVATLPAQHDYTLVCESGVYSADDIKRMQKSNVNCFLVGESLMRQTDVTHATQTLLAV